MSEKKFTVQIADPKSLVPYSRNAKIHNAEQIKKLSELIERFGFDQPIVVDKEMVIIKGHARREAALHLGLSKVPVYVADHLSEEEIKAARLADNRIAESGYDSELLKFEFQSLIDVKFDMNFTAFDDFQIDSFLNPKKSEDEFSEKSHESVKERKESYDESEFRQMILIMGTEEYEDLMAKFEKLQTYFKVETNLEVVLRLIKLSKIDFKKIKIGGKKDAQPGKKKARKK